jgi:hypothetical protein
MRCHPILHGPRVRGRKLLCSLGHCVGGLQTFWLCIGFRKGRGKESLGEVVELEFTSEL